MHVVGMWKTPYLAVGDIHLEASSKMCYMDTSSAYMDTLVPKWGSYSSCETTFSTKELYS